MCRSNKNVDTKCNIEKMMIKNENEVLTTLGGKLMVGMFCGYKSSTECSDKVDEFALTNDS